MGFRFRKSMKLGPVRVNLSKSGVGYSVGGKGLRFTKKAGGGTRTTTSIPGTGVSYVKDSSSAKTKSPAKKASNAATTKPKKSKVGIWAAALAFLALLGACNDGSSGTPVPTNPTEAAIIETTEAPDAVTEATAQAAEELTRQEPTIDTEPVVIETTQPIPEQTDPPTEATTEPEVEKHTYVLNTGTRKFHYEWCSSVDDMKESNKKILETTREDVISRGYDPCGRCKP